MKNKRTKTEEANIALNKALDGEDEQKETGESLTDKNYSAAEQANIKLNNAFYGDNRDDPNTERFVNNNHISLVLTNNEKEDE